VFCAQIIAAASVLSTATLNSRCRYAVDHFEDLIHARLIVMTSTVAICRLIIMIIDNALEVKSVVIGYVSIASQFGSWMS
jgi:hypothetical protein